MSENVDLFPVSSELVTYPPVKTWRMVTNHSNLFYMIAAGMIMPPKGFGKKYYQDTLSAFPGYIPLFPEHVSQSAIDYSVSEKSHLLPCILQIDHLNLSGPVKIIKDFGRVEDAVCPDGVDSSCKLMLIPAPLPMNCVKSIIFKSKEDKVRCEKDSADFNNVDLSCFEKKVVTGDFTKLKEESWPIQDVHIEPLNTALDLPMAAGAMMGLLVNMSDRGEIFIKTTQLAFDQQISSAELNSYPVISAMGDWMKNGVLPESSDVSQKLFWDIVNKVACSRFSNEYSSVIDVAINYLEAMPIEQFDEKSRAYGERLGADLRAISGFASSTISEIFERHPKPVSRAMALFVLREKIDDLLDFKSTLLTEADYVLASILFAAREGWIGISNDLRKVPGLSAAVNYRMAAMSHRISGTQFNLGAAPERPKSLIELFSNDSGAMSKIQNEAALYLSRELKWDCIQTRIKLDKGDYQLAVTSNGIQLTLDGDIKAVVTEVIHAKFILELCSKDIPEKFDRYVRDLFKGAK